MIDRAIRDLALVLAVFTVALAAHGSPVMSVPGEPAPVITKDATSLDLRTSAYPETAVAEVRFPEIAPERLELMRERNSSAGAEPLQIGVDRLVADEAAEKSSPRLHWVALAEGGWVSRFAATSPGAAALRIEMSISNLPDTAEFRFVGNGQSRSVVEPVVGKELNNHIKNSSTYWSPVTAGDRQLIEIYIARGDEPAQVLVSVIGVAHLYASPYGSLSGLKIGESDFCQVDANCVPAPPVHYTNSKNAVAHMVFQVSGSSFICTGTLLADTENATSIPFFYSAEHCISTQVSASTLTTFWFKESTSCGSGIASIPVQVAGGAAILVSDPTTDALLLRLNNPAPSGAWFNAWDANPVSFGTDSLIFHHPSGDVKKVTIGRTLGFDSHNGAGSFIRVGYNGGATEGGSSGAGLLLPDSNGLSLRGGLFGGSTFCDSPGVGDDIYSRFDLVYPRLQPFLAPSGQSNLLVVSRVGTGTGTLTSNPSGINCGTTCSASFSSGASVTLTATPVAGSVFSGWSGDCSGAGSCIVTMNQARNITATFTQSTALQVLNVSRVGTGTGTLTSGPSGINCGTTCSASFSSGTSVTLTATPAAGSVFSGWNGDCLGPGGCTVTMSQARNVTATFAEVGVFQVLNVSRVGTGTGTLNSNPGGINCGTACSAGFNSGTTVTLTAAPAADSVFSGWSGDCIGVGSCVVIMSQARNITATFSSAAPPVTEGFNTITNGCVAGWTCTNNSSPAGAIGWFAGNAQVFSAHAGAGDDYIGANFQSVSGIGTISNWLISPQLNFNNGAQLRFWTRVTNPAGWADRLEVRISTAGSSTNVGNSAASVGDFTTVVAIINPNLQVGAGACPPGTGPYPNEWCEIVIGNVQGLPTGGTGRVAFRYFVTGAGPGGGANSSYIGIDTFSFTPGTTVSGVDEPSASRVALPTPNPANASCPSGFFIATVGDGPGTGLTAGAFGMELLLDDPGTRVLAGGLNFGGLIDLGQAGFAGFTIANPSNEPQRLTLNLTGSPSASSSGSIQVRVRIARRTATTTDVVFETITVITLGTPFVTSIDLPPAFYEATVSPVSGTVGGSPEGQFYFSLTTNFVNRPGGGFQGGAVVGGYHTTHPFGGVSGFAGFCLATPHGASVRVLSAPSYGPSGARDLRLRILDAQQSTIVVVPGG